MPFSMKCGAMNPYGNGNFSEVQPSTYEAEPWNANFLHSLYRLKLMFGNQIWHDSGMGILRSATPRPMGGATGGCGGTMSPPTFETSGLQGVQRGGPMKMIFASTADSLYSVLYK